MLGGHWTWEDRIAQDTPHVLSSVVEGHIVVCEEGKEGWEVCGRGPGLPSWKGRLECLHEKQ